MKAAARKEKLTELLIKHLRPADKTFCVWDTEQRGLVLRVQPTGLKAWKCIYSHHGQSRWYHIGKVDVVGLADARKLAARVMFRVEVEGADPAAEKKHDGVAVRHKRPSVFGSKSIADKWRGFAARGIKPTCFLYRHFDAKGDLLYVGMSLDVWSRQWAHFRQAEWANTIYQIVIEPFGSREELIEAEAIAIKTEYPKYNKAHNDRTLRRALVAP
jgi:hypothetical protein